MQRTLSSRTINVFCDIWSAGHVLSSNHNQRKQKGEAHLYPVPSQFSHMGLLKFSERELQGGGDDEGLGWFHLRSSIRLAELCRV